MNNKLIQILINNKIIKQEDKSIYEYGLFVICFNLLTIFVVLFLGAISQNLSSSFIFLLSFIPIRILSGGFHLKSPSKCLLFFSMCFIIILWLYTNHYIINDILLVLMIIVNCIMLIQEYHNRLRILFPLIAFILINFMITYKNKNLYIIQYSLLFNFILYSIPKIQNTKQWLLNWRLFNKCNKKVTIPIYVTK